jgi:predicted DNA-binding WGR domain protein
MKPIYLERHDPDKNLHRFYQLFITPGIFGDWSLWLKSGAGQAHPEQSVRIGSILRWRRG